MSNTFESLLNGEYATHAIQFETYWVITGQYYWKSKHNAWIRWLGDKWDTGLINIAEYRDLILVDFQE